MASAQSVIAVDTNLLVYAHRRGVPEHRRAREALERAASEVAGWGISFPVLGEFLSIVTNPKAFTPPSTLEQAAAFIRDLIQSAAMAIWLPGVTFVEDLLRHAVNQQVSRAAIFDLQIALIAADNGASEIWTHDSNFVRLPGLRVRDPL